MAMEATIKANPEADRKIKDLGNILSLLQSALERILADVNVSGTVLPLGIMTGLTDQLQKAIDNPLQDVADTALQINAQLRQMLHRTVVAFLQHKKDHVAAAAMSAPVLGGLLYSIALKEDTLEHRQEMFEFLDKYDLLDFSAEYPIQFQFTPIELIGKVKANEVISLS